MAQKTRKVILGVVMASIAIGSMILGASEAYAQADPVGGSATGVTLRRIVCQDRTTQQTVVIRPTPGQTSWDCEAAGLVVLSGDRVNEAVAGIVDSSGVSVGGSVSGVTLRRVICLNATTAQQVQIVPVAGQLSWDCEASGLVVSVGDRVTQSVAGTVD